MPRSVVFRVCAIAALLAGGVAVGGTMREGLGQDIKQSMTMRAVDFDTLGRDGRKKRPRCYNVNPALLQTLFAVPRVLTVTFFLDCPANRGESILVSPDLNTATGKTEAKELAKWITDLDFKNDIKDPDTIDPTSKVDVINHARAVSMQKLNGLGYVMTHLYGKLDSVVKKRYALLDAGTKYAATGDASTLTYTGDYYFVVDTWKVEEAEKYEGYKVTTYNVYALITDGTEKFAVRTGISGAVRMCSKPHKPYSGEGATFQTCKTIAKIAGDRETASDQGVRVPEFLETLSIVRAMHLVGPDKLFTAEVGKDFLSVVSRELQGSARAAFEKLREQSRTSQLSASAASSASVSTRAQTSDPAGKLIDELKDAARNEEGLIWWTCASGCCSADEYSTR